MKTYLHFAMRKIKYKCQALNISKHPGTAEQLSATHISKTTNCPSP